MKKRFFVLLIVFLVALPLTVCACFGSESTPSMQPLPQPLTALVLGTDTDAQNTDVILFLRYVPADSSLSVMQIPRDTYLKNDLGAPKINHIFPALIASGKTEKEALSHTAAILSAAFSISFDAAVALRPSALARLVDEIGGVPINVPTDMTYEDPDQGVAIHLKAGPQILDGEAAVQFVRYRSGYVEGDLGRVDAQKLFLASFLSQAIKELDISRILSLLFRPPEGMSLSLDALRLAGVARHFYQNKNTLKTVYFSIPGEAVSPENGGAWYYAVNRNACAQILSRYFGRSNPSTFDKQGRLCGPTLIFENIYFAEGYPYRVYTDDEIQDIIIKKKE